MRLWELWKRFASSTNMNFMKLFNYLDWEHSRLGVPWRLVLKPRESGVFGLFNTKHLHRNAQSCIGATVLHLNADVVNLPVWCTPKCIKKGMLLTSSKGYFCTIFYIRWARDVTSPPTTTQATNKHHHHGDGAACPSSIVDSMIPRRPRGRRPCACSFWGRCWRICLIC